MRHKVGPELKMIAVIHCSYAFTIHDAKSCVKGFIAEMVLNIDSNAEKLI